MWSSARVWSSTTRRATTAAAAAAAVTAAAAATPNVHSEYGTAEITRHSAYAATGGGGLVYDATLPPAERQEITYDTGVPTGAALPQYDAAAAALQ
mmetsp:Transcript_36881/g.90291  ORF Transcript_36881/g.90291 Transcript_36881/m.90291 type:complete len:96 (-) Transcript_36881:47-334(-)